LLSVFSHTLLLPPTFLFIHRSAVLFGDLFAVVEIKSPAFFPGLNFTIVTCNFAVGCFFLAITFLTLFSFHVSVLFNVNFPTFLVWYFLTGLL